MAKPRTYRGPVIRNFVECRRYSIKGRTSNRRKLFHKIVVDDFVITAQLNNTNGTILMISFYEKINVPLKGAHISQVIEKRAR